MEELIIILLNLSSYEILDVSATLVKEKANTDFFAERPHLKALHRKFEELTPIKEYFASSSYIRRPINSPPCEFVSPKTCA